MTPKISFVVCCFCSRLDVAQRFPSGEEVLAFDSNRSRLFGRVRSTFYVLARDVVRIKPKNFETILEGPNDHDGYFIQFAYLSQSSVSYSSYPISGYCIIRFSLRLQKKERSCLQEKTTLVRCRSPIPCAGLTWFHSDRSQGTEKD